MRALLIAFVLLAVSIATVVWRASLLADANTDAAAVRSQLAAARQAAAEIEQLSKFPPTAIAPGMTDAELIREVQSAITAAGIPSGAIRDMAIDARSDHRAGPANAGLSKRAGRMSPEGLTMPQLGAALIALRERLPPLRIEQVNIQKLPSSEDPPLFRVAIMFAAFAPIMPNPPALLGASATSPPRTTSQPAVPVPAPSATPATTKR